MCSGSATAWLWACARAHCGRTRRLPLLRHRVGLGVGLGSYGRGWRLPCGLRLSGMCTATGGPQPRCGWWLGPSVVNQATASRKGEPLGFIRLALVSPPFGIGAGPPRSGVLGACVVRDNGWAHSCGPQELLRLAQRALLGLAWIGTSRRGGPPSTGHCSSVGRYSCSELCSGVRVVYCSG